MHVIWMWMRFGSRLGPISNQFGGQFGVPKLLQKWSEYFLFLVPFLKPFCMRSLSSSSASWEPSWASYAHLGKPLDPKNLKKPMVFQCFCKFSFLGLWSSQWPSWTHLGSCLARSGPKTVPKCPRNYLKAVQKVIQKAAPQKVNSKTILGSNLGWFWAKKSRAHFAPAPPVQLQIS